MAKLLTPGNMADFSDFLLREMELRGMTQADLARATNMSTGGVNHLINKSRKPSPVTCNAIAKAFNLPPEFVLRMAGYLPDVKDTKRISEEVIGYKTKELDQKQLDEVIQFIEFVQDRDDKARKTAYKTTREGQAPPEVVKGN